MSDLIDRKAAIEVIEEYSDRLQMVNWQENPGVPYKAHALNWCVNTIRDLPSAEPERKTGHWIITEGEYMHSRKYRCSECGHQFRWIYDQVFPPVFNYCKNCGARMDL